MRKVIYIQILQVVTLLIGIFTTPYYLRYISAEQYGFIVLFSQLIVYLGIFDFGIGSFLIQKIAAHPMKQGGDDLPRRIISRSFGILLIVLAILSPLSFLLAFRIDHVFQLSFSVTNPTKLLMFLCFFTTLIALFFRPLVSALVAKEHMLFNSLSSAVTILIYSVGSLVLLSFGLGLESFFYAQLTGAIAGITMNYLFLKKSTSFEVRVDRPAADDFSQIFLPSLLIFANGLAAQLIYNGDRIILAKFVSVSILTAFTLNIRVIEIAQNFLIKLTDLYIPKIVKVSQATYEQALSYYHTFTQAITVLTVLAVLNLVALNQPFVSLWVGSDYLLNDSVIIVLYLCVMFSHVVFRIPSLFLYGVNRNKGYTSASVIDAVLNLTLSITLVRQYGIKGVVLATLIATLLTSVPANIILLHKMFNNNVTVLRLLKPVLQPLLISAPLLIGTFYFQQALFEAIHTWLDFAIFAAFINIIFIGGLFLLNYRGYSNLRLIVAEINHAFHR